MEIVGQASDSLPIETNGRALELHNRLCVFHSSALTSRRSQVEILDLGLPLEEH